MNDCKINDVSFMAESLSPFTLFPVRAETPVPDFKMALSFVVIGSIAATALKFINNTRT